VNKALAILVALLYTGHAMAADYGLGISAKSDSGLLYVPIDVSKGLRVEPFVRHSSTSSKQTVDFGDGPRTFRTESDLIEGGIGVFGLAEPKESVRLYYGGRASYFDSESDSTSSSGSRQSSYGYRITPTVGFEYLFTRRFTLGGEVGYYVESRHVDTTILGSRQEFDSDNSGTESFLILRYFF
jgi:hypothetical protein